MPVTPPTRLVERGLATLHGGLVAGVDEVGRGALAGPVCVGVAVIGYDADPLPTGLTDSKKLTPARRTAMAPHVMDWCVDLEVGSAEPSEIDRIGINPALRLAATRAFDALAARGVVPAVALLDGCHDWLGAEPDLLATLDPLTPPALPLPVVTRVKADLECAVVAAASVVAKVYRDGLMDVLGDAARGDGRFDWSSNKGYASPRHIDALRSFGPTEHHRRSWKLPGVGGDGSTD